MKIKIIIITLCVFVAAGAVFFFSRDNFIIEKDTAAAALKAYQLYTAAEKQKEITLYFGNPGNDGFKPVKTGIFETPILINQVKQALLLLLAGPPQDALRLIPDGTMLRDAYIDSSGIVYADFTQELNLNSPGGSTAEYLTVYSVLYTLFQAFPWIKGIKIIVDGRETMTLAGHISLESVFRPDDISGQQD